MSFGSILKGIGKGVLSVGKVAVNVAGNVVGVGTIIPSNGGAQNAAVASINPNVRDGNPGFVAAPSIWGQLAGNLTDALGGLGNWLNGRTQTQNRVTIGTGDNNQNGLPSWLLPAGILAAVLLLFSGGSKSRRY
jgi:hypothetical protein